MAVQHGDAVEQQVQQAASTQLRPARATVQGRCIFYRTSTGLPSQCGTPLVCVPGLNVSLSHLMPMCQQLAPHVAIYALDLPGYGKSQNPPHFQNLTEMADTVAAWMRAIGLERAALFGISFSAQIVSCLAVRHPEMVSRLILSSPTVDPSSRPLPKLIWRWWKDRESEPSYVHKATLASYERVNPLRALYTLWQMVRDHMEDRLPAVQCPTLVVRGGCDVIASQRWVERATCLIPDARLVVIPGGTHALDMDMPQELARAVCEFVCEASGQWPASAQSCQPSWPSAMQHGGGSDENRSDEKGV